MTNLFTSTECSRCCQIPRQGRRPGSFRTQHVAQDGHRVGGTRRRRRERDLDGGAAVVAARRKLLAAYLSHPDGQAALAAIAQSGTIQMNLTVNAISKLEIPLPPIDVQRQMVDMLTTADIAYESAIEAAHARRQLARSVTIDRILNQSRT